MACVSNPICACFNALSCRFVVVVFQAYRVVDDDKMRSSHYIRVMSHAMSAYSYGALDDPDVHPFFGITVTRCHALKSLAGLDGESERARASNIVHSTHTQHLSLVASRQALRLFTRVL